MAKRAKRTKKKVNVTKSPVGQSRRRGQRHAVKLQVVTVKRHRGKGYRWQTIRATGGKGIPIAVSGHTFSTARSAAYHGRNMNPHLVIAKVEFR